MKFDPSDRSAVENYLFLLGAIVPRPIALVSTVSLTGVFNVAPFSFFNGVCAVPPILSVSIAPRDGKKKDTLINIEKGGEFVVNVVTEPMAAAMNESSAFYPPEVSEFIQAGFTPISAEKVKAPLVRESPISLECRLYRLVEVGTFPHGSTLVLGEIVFCHVIDEILENHRAGMEKLNAIGRMGGEFYTRTRDLFKMKRPK